MQEELSTFEEILEAVRGGTNPVTVAGYGREATHKGYLEWMLHTRHWVDARDAVRRLAEHASWPDGRREEALRRVAAFPEEIWCCHEERLGRRKVDLEVLGWVGKSEVPLPIELKTDSAMSKEQFQGYSKELKGAPGLVVLLGTSAIRQECRQESGDFGDLGVLRPDDLLRAWADLAPRAPAPVQHWLAALRFERTRLERAAELPELEGHRPWEAGYPWWLLGYRDAKGPWFGLLHALRLHPRGAGLGRWDLYDGGHNTVLNLDRGDWSWLAVAGGAGRAFWEFNDGDLVLKVQVLAKDNEQPVRTWIEDTQSRILAADPEARRPKRKAPKGKTWLTVVVWERAALGWGEPAVVAARAAEIVRGHWARVGAAGEGRR